MTQTYLKERLSQKFNFEEWKELFDKIFTPIFHAVSGKSCSIFLMQFHHPCRKTFIIRSSKNSSLTSV